MRIIKLAVISLVACAITACSTTSQRGYFKDERQSYRHSQYVDRPVVIPQNLAASNMQTYYEVPQADQSQNAGSPPSLLPPGSQLNEQSRNQSVEQSRVAQAQMPGSPQDRIRLAENAKIYGHTNPTPAMSQNTHLTYAQAWTKVGRGLQSSNYKIVERDNSMGTYYVLDTRNTGGKVKKDMPIYQVRLHKQGSGTTFSVTPANPTLQSVVARSMQ